jgi:indole-3-glycerol phosphate synthase
MSTALRRDFLATKAASVRARRSGRDSRLESRLHAVCLGRPPAPSLSAALSGGGQVAVMAEFKRRSPSAGPLGLTESPAAVAAGYVAAGAAALSVLTDFDHFGGTLADLAAASCREPGTPVLRKDFIVDPGQLFEARAAGAAAVLLIVAMLGDAELAELLASARDVGLECLVEVHSEAELDRAGAAGATLVGINNRDLRSLTTDLGVTERLASRAPAGTVVVSESGIRCPTDVTRVRDAGAQAVLIGEALVRVPTTERLSLLRRLAGVNR